VVLSIRGIDQYIVQIRGACPVQKVVERIVDVVLERRGCGIKAKKHYQGFEEAETCDKSRFLFVAFGDAEFVERGDDIQLRINFGVIKGIQCFSYQRERVTVFNNNVVKSSIILIYTYPSVWFNYQQ